MTFGCLLGALWNPLDTLGVSIGSLWVPFGSRWIPFGPLWGHFGGPWPPLGPYFGDFGIILGPSDCRKVPKSDEVRCWDVVFVNSSIYSASLDEHRTIKGVLTKGVHLMKL